MSANDPAPELTPDALNALYQRATADYLRARRSTEGPPEPTAWLDSYPSVLRPALVKFLDGLRVKNTPVSPPLLPPEILATLSGYHIERDATGAEKEYGHGGSARVLKASETFFGRPVAIKVFHPTERADPHSAIARMWAEAQFLASLQDQSVPAVHQFGSDPEYGPFIVMQPACGDALSKELDKRWGAQDYVQWACEVFQKVCEAVGRAHEKGHSHRDLKPGHVFVGSTGEVWVLDWGLGRSDSTSGTGAHNAGSHPPARPSTEGTPAYMAPEQARGEARADGKRTDVFLLGGLLCKLLTGVAPFENCTDANPDKRLRARGRAEKKLKQQERRFPELVQLARKCLEPDPDKRYANAEEVAKEVRKYRAEVVNHKAAANARRPWLRTLAAVGVLALVSVSVLLKVAVHKWEDAERTRDDLRIEVQRARLAEWEANRRSDQLRTAYRALGDAVRGLDPWIVESDHTPPTVAAANRIVKHADALLAVEDTDALVAAEFRATLGSVLLRVGQFQQAHTLLSRAHETLRQMRGDEHPATLTVLHNLGRAELALGRPRDATRTIERVWQRRQHDLSIDPDRLETLGLLATAYGNGGNVQRALRLHEEHFKLTRIGYGSYHRRTLLSLNNWIVARQHAGALDTSVALAHLYNLTSRHVGSRHPLTLTVLHNWASAFRIERNHGPAIEKFAQCAAERRDVLGPNHRDTLMSSLGLGTAYWAAGNSEQAVRILRDVARLLEDQFGPTHPDTLTAKNNLAVALQVLGKRESRDLFEAVLNGRTALYGADHYATVQADYNVAMSDLNSGNVEVARPGWTRYLDWYRKRDGSGTRAFAGKLAEVGGQLLRRQHYADAEPLLRECSEILTRLGPSDWTAFNAQSQHGECLTGLKEYKKAEPLLRAAYLGLTDRKTTIPAVDRARLVEAVDRLVTLYTASKAHDLADLWRAERALYPPERAPPPRTRANPR